MRNNILINISVRRRRWSSGEKNNMNLLLYDFMWLDDNNINNKTPSPQNNIPWGLELRRLGTEFCFLFCEREKTIEQPHILCDTKQVSANG